MFILNVSDHSAARSTLNILARTIRAPATRLSFPLIWSAYLGSFKNSLRWIYFLLSPSHSIELSKEKSGKEIVLVTVSHQRVNYIFRFIESSAVNARRLHYLSFLTTTHHLERDEVRIFREDLIYSTQLFTKRQVFKVLSRRNGRPSRHEEAAILLNPKYKQWRHAYMKEYGVCSVCVWNDLAIRVIGRQKKVEQSSLALHRFLQSHSQFQVGAHLYMLARTMRLNISRIQVCSWVLHHTLVTTMCQNANQILTCNIHSWILVQVVSAEIMSKSLRSNLSNKIIYALQTWSTK